MKSVKSRTMPGNSGRKGSFCTKCGRPSRGHVGPQGEHLAMHGKATPVKQEGGVKLDFD